MISLIKLANEGKLEKTGAKPKLTIKVDGVSSEALEVWKSCLNIDATMMKMDGLRQKFRNIKMNWI